MLVILKSRRSIQKLISIEIFYLLKCYIESNKAKRSIARVLDKLMHSFLFAFEHLPVRLFSSRFTYFLRDRCKSGTS
jgi:hypothetical protein